MNQQIDDIAFLIIRLLTLIPLTYLVITQAINYVKNYNKHNGLKQTRLTLLTLTTALWSNILVFFIADVNGTLFNNSKHGLLGDLRWILIFIQLIILLAVWRFYLLVWNDKKYGKD